LAAGLLTLLDPLRRKAGISGFVHVTSLSALPEDGTPRRFPVIADRVDAWNKFPARADRRGLSSPQRTARSCFST
jgi:hypothetical protein